MASVYFRQKGCTLNYCMLGRELLTPLDIMYTHGKKLGTPPVYEGRLKTKVFLQSKYVLTQLFH